MARAYGRRSGPRGYKQLAELLARIVVNDREVEHLNAHALPRNHGRLLCA